jgi:Tol biopolymer transport system component
MPDFVNPYTPGQPVANPTLFFGRRDLLASIQEQLLKGRRVFFVAGARRMGKTSLLRQLAAHTPEGWVAVRVDLREEEAHRLDWLLWRLAEAIGQQVGRALGSDMPAPAWSDFEGQTDALLDRFWPQVRALLGDRSLLLLLDDLGALEQAGSGLLDTFVAVLTTWRDRDSDLAVVLAETVAQQEALMRRHPRLLGGALTYTLGPLNSEEATRLITWPVDGLITYDYGVARRLIEITSGHPYYLQLLCFEVSNRCAQAGWVNQRDVDLVLEDLVGREIPDFRRVWDGSSPQEQATLAALVSLRGARGVATVQEVRTLLTKAGARPDRGQVGHALEHLVERGILERLGALSYRFRVALLRDWLAERIDLKDVVRDTRWDAPGRRRTQAEPPVSKLLTRKERKDRGTAPPEAAEEAGAALADQPQKARSRPWLGIGAAVALALVLLVAAGLAFRPVFFGPTPTPTHLLPTSTLRLSTATPTRLAQSTTQPVAVGSPTRTPTSLPPTATFTPSPTPPLIVSRPVPAIAYQSRGPGDEHWSIYVMDSDGSNRTRLTDGQSEAFSPVWSPDSSKIAFGSDRDGNLDIWVMDSDGSNPVNLTHNEAKDRWPAWSPDGQWIAFASVRDVAYWELYVMRADGSDVQRLTWWEDASDWSPSWSPDGTRLAFGSYRDGNWEIYTMDRDGSNLLRLTDNPADDSNPAWSPDGGRIAFESTRGEGYTDIYVMPITGGEAVDLTNSPWSTDLGPTWSPDGGRIAFYSDRDGEWDIYVMASDGSNVVKLTGDTTIDQVPSWRP